MRLIRKIYFTASGICSILSQLASIHHSILYPFTKASWKFMQFPMSCIHFFHVIWWMETIERYILHLYDYIMFLFGSENIRVMYLQKWLDMFPNIHSFVKFTDKQNSEFSIHCNRYSNSFPKMIYPECLIWYRTINDTIYLQYMSDILFVVKN